MKYLISTVLLTLLAGCNSTNYRGEERLEFDWMPHPVVWEHNIRTCRSQTHCTAAQLFQR